MCWFQSTALQFPLPKWTPYKTCFSDSHRSFKLYLFPHAEELRPTVAQNSPSEQFSEMSPKQLKQWQQWISKKAFVTVIVATGLHLVMESASQNARTHYILSARLITMMDSQTDESYSFLFPLANSFRPLCSVISQAMLLFTCTENFIQKLAASRTQCETGKA